MKSAGDDEQLLTIKFDCAKTEADAYGFLQQLADAWSASLAVGQPDPWYGNLYVDIRWAGVQPLKAQQSGAIDIRTSMEMTTTDGVPVDSKRLSGLRWSPLTDVFVEGMKAPQPKSKFLFWFVILEELEKRTEFRSLFNPMFEPEQKEALRDVVRLDSAALQRLKSLLDNPDATRESRAVKLSRILDEIGCSSVAGLNISTLVDEACCRKLIAQRNLVAHKGGSIDTDFLYSVLFPLSIAALNYILDQEAESATESES